MPEINNMPHLEVNPNTWLCVNCNQSISNEIHIIKIDPNCLRINVLTQTRNSSSLICDAVGNLPRLSNESKTYFLKQIFIRRQIMRTSLR